MKKLFAVALIATFAVACSSTDKKADNAEAKATAEAKMETKLVKTDQLKCELNSDVRLVELSKANGIKLCEVHYSKEGSKERIASAEHQAKFCDNVLGNVKNNLTSAGFKCEM